MNHDPNASTTCSACGKSIKFVMTSPGKWMPVDAELFVVKEASAHQVIVRSDGTVQKGTKPGDAGYTSHFATCSAPEKFRKARKGVRL